jgi:hypothetical protein
MALLDLQGMEPTTGGGGGGSGHSGLSVIVCEGTNSSLSVLVCN